MGFKRWTALWRQLERARKTGTSANATDVLIGLISFGTEKRVAWQAAARTTFATRTLAVPFLFWASQILCITWWCYLNVPHQIGCERILRRPDKRELSEVLLVCACVVVTCNILQASSCLASRASFAGQNFAFFARYRWPCIGSNCQLRFRECPQSRVLMTAKLFGDTTCTTMRP